jgi:hypothetical protein
MLKCYRSMALKHTWDLEQTKGVEQCIHYTYQQAHTQRLA